MKVSDKDLDQLFNSRLADMEMEPSASVWGNIAGELDGKKEERKRGLPFMQIAAGIVVIMAASLFFIRPEDQTIALHPVTNQSNTDVLSGRPTISAEEPTLANTSEPANAGTEPISVANTRSNIASADQHRSMASRTARYIKNDQPAQNIDTAQNSVENIAIAAVRPGNNNTAEQKPAENITPVQQPGLAPDVKNSVIAKNSLAGNANPLALASDQPSAKAGVKDNVKRKKIHSLGDLLNVVIAKVDKREDKLIEFTNNSDEDSFNVTGVNLGLLKAKKDK